MSKKKTAKKITTRLGLNVTQFNDKWSDLQTRLEGVAQEQVQADIQLVNAASALKLAQVAHTKAIQRKTLAEKRLSALRSNLGAE